MQSCMQRLMTAKTPTLIQQIIIVFAKMILTHTQTCLNLLVSMNLPGEGNGLQFLMTKWTELHTEFSGAYHIKLSTVALVTLMRDADPRLEQIGVKGTPNPTAGRTTRSKAKATIPLIPLRVKIFKILVMEFLLVLEEDNAPADLSSSDDEGELDLGSIPDAADVFLSVGTFDNIVDVGYGSSDPAKAAFMASNLFNELIDGKFNDDLYVEDIIDPELKNDPIYNINLKEYLINLFREESQNQQTFPRYAASLTDHERSLIQKNCFQ